MAARSFAKCTRRGFYSQAPNRVHFGLGDDAKIDKLSIRWPNGSVQELKNISADRHIVVEEGVEGDKAIANVK
ncbi:MAG: ASPIC/UnbV domain-containing protein [Gemmataceae bacterium]